MKIDLFNNIVPEEKLNRNFITIKEQKGYSAARVVINEIYNSQKPIDNHFVQQFQTTGFNSRIWELYLLAVFQEQNFLIERKHDRPDFELIKDKDKIFIEAVTTNPSFNQEIIDKLEVMKEIKEENFEEFIYKLRDESTIRIAGALYNKLRESYWDLDWVKDNPIILAIEPFHHSLAHWLSDSNLIGYLYGFHNQWHHDEKGKLIIETCEQKEHKTERKTIPSNFFSIENSENISAVMFSNSGTISKFNRIGKLKGYCDSSIRMLRVGQMYNPDPNSAFPILFKYFVGENGPSENWSQGISMYHNPNAKYPINRELFPWILHGYFDNKFYSYIPDFFPIQSETYIMVTRENEDKKDSNNYNPP